MRAKHVFAKWLSLATGLALAVGGSEVAAQVSPQGSDRATSVPIEQEFRAAYPLDLPSSSVRLAGVALDQLHIPGLLRGDRSDDAGDDGGVLLRFVDRAGSVRVLLQIAVMPDVLWARRVLGTELRGVSLPLARALDPLLGDLAYADDGGRGSSLVLATQANIAYRVHVLEGGAELPSAANIAGLVRTAMVAGAPSYPAVSLQLPSGIDVKEGAALRVFVPSGLPYTLRADGAYVAHGQAGPLVRPFAAGPITVYATVASPLGCVTVTSQHSIAQ